MKTSTTQSVFDHLVGRSAPLGSTASDTTGGDMRALPDGRVVPLDWREEEQPEAPVIDRGSRRGWD
jgi:hypothetical protein